MLLIEVAQLMMEMARPAKICPDCGKSMAGNHFWYKGGWKCKKANRTQSTDDKQKDDKPSEEKKSPKPANNAADDEKEHKGSVKGLEREAGEDQDPDVKAAEAAEKKAKTKRVGDSISPAEMREISADTEEEAREFVNKTFPKASAEAKARAVNFWKRQHKE